MTGFVSGSRPSSTAWLPSTRTPDGPKRVSDAGLVVEVSVKAGPRVIGATFPREQWEDEGVLQPRQHGFALAVNDMPDTNPRVGSIEITGPLMDDGPGDIPSRRRILTCRPATPADEPGCATDILSVVARRAYRRPVTDDDIGTLLEFYEAGRQEGDFESGIQFALERLLASPDLLLRIERDPVDAAPGTAYPISDVELASRLLFFLWSSLPDDELLALAEVGTLAEPTVLARQVRRLLADDRASDRPTGLRDMLLARPADFVGTVTEKLMTYALGRGVEYYDMPTMRRIVREAEAADYRWSAVIFGIIESAPFQMRRSES